MTGLLMKNICGSITAEGLPVDVYFQILGRAREKTCNWVNTQGKLGCSIFLYDSLGERLMKNTKHFLLQEIFYAETILLTICHLDIKHINIPIIDGRAYFRNILQWDSMLLLEGYPIWRICFIV